MSSTAPFSVRVVPLTRGGCWVLEETAAEMLTDCGGVKTFNKLRKDSLWVVIERRPTNLLVHKKNVYLCYDKNQNAARSLPIKKGGFARLSHYLSDESNTSFPDDNMAELFKVYTGEEATVTTIKLAFSVGALILSQSLEKILNPSYCLSLLLHSGNELR